MVAVLDGKNAEAMERTNRGREAKAEDASN
jgi:hypothetical protein